MSRKQSIYGNGRVIPLDDTGQTVWLTGSHIPKVVDSLDGPGGARRRGAVKGTDGEMDRRQQTQVRLLPVPIKSDPTMYRATVAVEGLAPLSTPHNQHGDSPERRAH